MFTFWALGNKVAALLPPQIYTATTSIGAASAAVTAASRVGATEENTFGLLWQRKYSR